MPPAPQAAQLAGQKQSQQQYDPTTGPPVQNAASLHTPPPQLPGRLPPAGLPAAPLPPALQFAQQPQAVEPHAQLQVPAKAQPPSVPVPAPPPGQLPAPPPQPVPQAPHAPMPGKAQMQAAPLSQPQVLGGHLSCRLEQEQKLSVLWVGHVPHRHRGVCPWLAFPLGASPPLSVVLPGSGTTVRSLKHQRTEQLWLLVAV